MIEVRPTASTPSVAAVTTPSMRTNSTSRMAERTRRAHDVPSCSMTPPLRWVSADRWRRGPVPHRSWQAAPRTPASHGDPRLPSTDEHHRPRPPNRNQIWPRPAGAPARRGRAPTPGPHLAHARRGGHARLCRDRRGRPPRALRRPPSGLGAARDRAGPRRGGAPATRRPSRSRTPPSTSAAPHSSRRSSAGSMTTSTCCPRTRVRGDRSEAENRRYNAQLMDTSKLVAIAVALDHLGHDVAIHTSGTVVRQIVEGSPAAGALQIDDVIVAVDGEPVDQPDEIGDAPASGRSRCAARAHRGAPGGQRHADRRDPADHRGARRSAAGRHRDRAGRPHRRLRLPDRRDHRLGQRRRSVGRPGLHAGRPRRAHAGRAHGRAPRRGHGHDERSTAPSDPSAEERRRPSLSEMPGMRCFWCRQTSWKR